MAKILEISQVTPFADGSSDYPPVSEFSLPLTLYDTMLIKLPPVERLFFYSLPEPNDTLFNSLLPKLKHSLSLTLRHFPPLSGALTWPRDSPKPVVAYRPPHDAVSLTVAECDSASFDLLSADHIPRQATLFHSLVPKLAISGTEASVMSLQITMFPNKGFCVAVTCHHAFLDGKSTTMFVKSWAHFCREAGQTHAVLPPELTPFFDRSVIRDPKGLDMLFLNQWSEIYDSKDYEKLFELPPSPEISPDTVLKTFSLSRKEIAKLRQDIELCSEQARLSTFVVAYSYIFLCIIKATKEQGLGGAKLLYCFAADHRQLLDPPVPETYFGNCIGAMINFDDAGKMKADGCELTTIAVKVSELVRKLERKDHLMEGVEDHVRKFSQLGEVGLIGVAGSPRFRDYETDFGWGKPRKVEIVSITKTGAVSMLESRGGSGGVELGVVLKKHQMEIFTCLFLEGLISN